MLKIVLVFSFSCLLISDVWAQQPSVIEQMQQIKPALVEITAINIAAKVNTSKQRSLFKDPQTGKILMLQKGATVANYQRAGAGVILHNSGIIVTNAHVVGQAEKIQVLLANEQKFSAKVVRFAPDLDLALLKIDADFQLPAVVLADSGRILLNEEIFTVGSSPLLKEAISGGKITGLASSRNASYSNSYESDFFQTSMNIYKGDSGGPLFNRKGELIGLMTAKLLSKDNSSFAVSSNKIRRYVNAYLAEIKPKNE